MGLATLAGCGDIRGDAASEASPQGATGNNNTAPPGAGTGPAGTSGGANAGAPVSTSPAPGGGTARPPAPPMAPPGPGNTGDKYRAPGTNPFV
ncbi:MAG TPA: hypothetical protein VGG33_27270, partial [Polyangia bacterium]